MFVSGGAAGKLPWAAFSLGDSFDAAWSRDQEAPVCNAPVNAKTLAATEPTQQKAQVSAARFGSQVGGTPLFDLTELAPDLPAGVKIYGKAEFKNMGMSHKDRIVSNILRRAEAEGLIVPHSGATLVAASSGNTGASVAMLGAQRGYRVVIITDAKCSREKCDGIRLYGAELIIAGPGQDYMEMEVELAAKHGWFSVDQ